MRDTAAVLPGDGWRAVYAVEGDVEGEDATALLRSVPLVAFRLVMDFDVDGEPELMGMVAEGNAIVPCLSPTLVGYLPADGQLSSLLPDLLLWHQAQLREAEADALASEISEEQAKSTSEKFSESGATGPN